MKYKACVAGIGAELAVEKEGLRLGSRFLDYADVAALRPLNHRVLIDTLSGESIEISMLGFSYDGFWEELNRCYGERSLEALFVGEEQLMLCEGEYEIPAEAGRANIALYPDAVCILPATCHALRIPLCYTKEIVLTSYQINITMLSGMHYAVGKMGYDTKPFFERVVKAADATKRQREKLLAKAPLAEPFTHKGLFRTKQTEQYWNAALTETACALEFFTNEDTATYLYRFSEPKELFLAKLREATEAVGVRREIIYLPQEQLEQNPLYRMAVDRSDAVRFLRSRSDGRLIHSANHKQRLADFLG